MLGDLWFCFLQASGDPAGNAVVSSGYAVFQADPTQQTAFYTPQETQSQPQVGYINFTTSCM